jgi:hypothetical protein
MEDHVREILGGQGIAETINDSCPLLHPLERRQQTSAAPPPSPAPARCRVPVRGTWGVVSQTCPFGNRLRSAVWGGVPFGIASKNMTRPSGAGPSNA